MSAIIPPLHLPKVFFSIRFVLASLVGGLMTLAASASLAQAPAAPNESVVTARVTGAVLVDATTLGMAPAQPICVLTLSVLSIKAAGALLPAIRATDKTVRAYTKDVGMTRLKGTTVTAALTRQGDERRGSLWLVRLEDFKETP
jgi:hypothetical protein